MIEHRAVRTERVEVFADYHQFYVQDGDANPSAPEDWSDEDVPNRAKVSESVVVMCPLRNMVVPVDVSLFVSEPSTAADADHVVECSLALPSGHLQVHECTGGPVLDWMIAPGSYAIRLLSFELRTLSAGGLEGDDRYEVQLWPAALRNMCVAKRWKYAA